MSKQRIEKLKKLIKYHRYLYHVLDKQEISDSALDSLKKELFDLEQKFPEFVTADSPTQRIGGRPLAKFKKVKHPYPMLSFNDAFSEEDMKDWLERISKLLSPQEINNLDFYCELKIDGLAIELIYEDNNFKVGSTRGDGKIGEDVTQNLKTIEAIPFTISTSEIVARGEVFMPKKVFENFKKDYANPRNLVAGSIRQLDPKITASRKLDSYIYDIMREKVLAVRPPAGGRSSKTFSEIKTHEEKHKVLKKLGFKTNPYNKYCKNLEEVFNFHKKINKIRNKIPYEIDGIVVIVNSNRTFEKLGTVGKAPRGAIAYKFPAMQKTTIIKAIEVQIGRTGVLTPVAHLNPVEVGGVVVSRATLHNIDEIKRLDVRIGDTVVIERAGDVIPDIIKVLTELRTGKEREFKMPTHCPICGEKVIKEEEEVATRCVNKNCFAQRKRYFNYFISKPAFDFSGLGPKIISQLIDRGMLSTPADLFTLKKEDLISLERFGEKSADNFIKAVQAKKEISFPKFIYALGIRNVGEETAIDLSQRFSDIEKLSQAKLEELEEIQDIGPVVARSIFDWFREPKNISYLTKLKEVGVRIMNYESRIMNRKLEGKSFVLTGSLDSMTRDEAKAKIRELGGEISTSVSKETNYLIAGLSPGSKYAEAKKLGVKILNEKEFINLLK